MVGLFSVIGCENSTRQADIVFVHGLAGHAWSTWDYQNRQEPNKDFWPAWLQQDLQQLGIETGIWTFGYHAPRFEYNGNGMARFDQASNLLEFLRVHDLGDRPLIFVTHSMGGLLVKEMLRTLQNFPDQNILQQTKGIVFLSTPHTGSHLANFIDKLGMILRSTVSVEELRAHTPELRSLNEWYRQNVENLGIATKVYYETQPTANILIVDADSANPSIRDVQPVAIAKDHNQITKISHSELQNDLVYLGIKSFIKKLFPARLQLPSSDTIILQHPNLQSIENPPFPL